MTDEFITEARRLREQARRIRADAEVVRKAFCCTANRVWEMRASLQWPDAGFIAAEGGTRVAGHQAVAGP
jgi:hypothetical protein